MVPGDLVEVLWVDANSPHPSVWMDPTEVAERNPVMAIKSSGYFIEKRDGYLLMAGDRSDGSEFKEVVNRAFFIPLGCIRGVRKMVTA